MKFGYYPGCALHGSSNDYEKSVRACLDKLQVSLEELEDWICCGATAAHSINQKLATALPARNLGIAQKQGLARVLAPCPMCSMELSKAASTIQDASIRSEMADIVELPLDTVPEIVNLIQIFQAVGLEQLKAKQVKSLDSFKPACYYGCLLTRPPKVLNFDDCEHPVSMETILNGLGAKTVDWNYKTECCGAGLTLCDADAVVDLSHRILENAQKHGADCLVVACPMCQMNLDMRQADVRKKFKTDLSMPIYYLSDLVGLAVGLTGAELGIDKHYN